MCSDGYTPQLGGTCSKCADEASGVVLVAVVFLVALVLAVAVVSYVLSGESGGRMSGVVARVTQFIPLQSVKIVIVAWQILTQVRATLTCPKLAMHSRCARVCSAAGRITRFLLHKS